MHYYRLYHMDSEYQHIINVRDFRADGDLAAIIKAGVPLLGESRELWNQGRKVLELRR
jgi:hypothetical protein